ncbi:hypothetical protein ACLK1S_23590 [Escherichia coli]
MDDDTLERMSVTISLPANRKRSGFYPQGGEPTLLGLFHRRAVKLQAKYGAGRRRSNSFQTNGVLLMINGVHFWQKIIFLSGYAGRSG